MKFSAVTTLLALVALTSTEAFAPSAPKTAAKPETALGARSPYLYDEPRVYERGLGGVGRGRGGPLARRGDSYDRGYSRGYAGSGRRNSWMDYTPTVIQGMF